MMFRNNINSSTSTAILIIAAVGLLVSSSDNGAVNNNVNAQVVTATCVGMTATETSSCSNGELPQLAVCTVPAATSTTADAVYEACCPDNNLNGFLDNMTCVLWSNYNGNVQQDRPSTGGDNSDVMVNMPAADTASDGNGDGDGGGLTIGGSCTGVDNTMINRCNEFSTTGSSISYTCNRDTITYPNGGYPYACCPLNDNLPTKININDKTTNEYNTCELTSIVGEPNTFSPTLSPTARNLTPQPTNNPTPQPTPQPTEQPTDGPTPEPTNQPTNQPTENPTPDPTPDPTPGPTPEPTEPPTEPPNDNGDGNNLIDQQIDGASSASASASILFGNSYIIVVGISASSSSMMMMMMMMTIAFVVIVVG